MERILEATSTDTVMSLFGSFDSNIKLIEREKAEPKPGRYNHIQRMGDNRTLSALPTELPSHGGPDGIRTRDLRINRPK